MRATAHGARHAGAASFGELADDLAQALWRTSRGEFGDNATIRAGEIAMRQIAHELHHPFYVVPSLQLEDAFLLAEADQSSLFSRQRIATIEFFEALSASLGEVADGHADSGTTRQLALTFATLGSDATALLSRGSAHETESWTEI